MRDHISERAWQLYRNYFVDGEKITVEGAHGVRQWGTLKTTNDGITLTRNGGVSVDIAWDSIVFMCHDGFPFKEIIGMTVEEADLRAEQTSTEIIRDKLQGLIADSKVRKTPQRRIIGGGCPFVYGPFEVINLVNPGNNGKQFWGEDNEETLILRSNDGAVAHSFDMSHLFLFDGLKL